MSRKQKLRNAVILGLMLSSVTAGSVWAAEGTEGPVFTEKGPVFVGENSQNPDLTGYQGNINIVNNGGTDNADFVSGIGVQGWVSGSIFSGYNPNNAILTLPKDGLNLNNLTITVGNMSADNAVVGIFAGGESKWGKDATGTVTVTVANDLVINATTYNEKEGYGILAKDHGTVNVTAGSITINATKGQENAGSGNLYGVKTYGSTNDTLNNAMDFEIGDWSLGNLIPEDLKGLMPSFDGADGKGSIVIEADGDINITASYKEINSTEESESAAGSENVSALEEQDDNDTGSNGLNLGLISGNSTAVDGNVQITSHNGNINIEAVADMGRAVAIGGGDGTIEATKGDVTAVAKSNINATSFLDLGSILGEDGISTINGLFGEEAVEVVTGLFGATTAISDKAIIAGGNVTAEATSIIGNVVGIDNGIGDYTDADGNKHAGIDAGGNVESTAGTVVGNATAITGNGTIAAGGNVTAMAGSLLGSAAGITGGGSINAGGDVTGIAVSGAGLSSVSGVINLDEIFAQLGLSEDVVEKLEPVVEKILAATASPTVGINDKAIIAGGNVTGVAGSLIGDSIGIDNDVISQTDDDGNEYSGIVAGGNVTGAAASVIGNATGITGSGTIEAAGDVTGIAGSVMGNATGIAGGGTIIADNVTGVAVSGSDLASLAGVVNFEELFGQLGLSKEVQTKLLAAIEGMIDAANVEPAVGIGDRTINATGNVVGTAESITGDVFGIDNDQAITAGGNVIGVANSVLGNATGITGAGNIDATGNVIAQAGSVDGSATGIESATINADKVIGMAETVNGIAYGINNGSITAKDVIAQAGSVNGDAVAITSAGTITADNLTGIAVSVNGNAIGIQEKTVSGFDNVTGVAGSLNKNATGINGGTITAANVTGIAVTGKGIEELVKDFEIFDKVSLAETGDSKGNAIGINGSTITATGTVYGMAGSYGGDATGINNVTIGSADKAADKVIGMAETVNGAAVGIKDSEIFAKDVIAQAGSIGGNATGITSDNEITAAGSIIGIAGSANKLATGIQGQKITDTDTVVGMAGSINGTAVGIESTEITNANNVFGNAANVNGDATGINGGTITAANVTGIAVTGKGIEELVQDFAIFDKVSLAETGNSEGIATDINGGTITASGTVYGMAGSYGGNATGIENATIVNADKVIGMAETVNGAAYGINGGSITANEVIGQAGSVNGEAVAITSAGTITADSIIGVAGSITGAATGIQRKAISGTDTVVGMAGSITGTATGIDTGDITEVGNVFGNAANVTGNATGINGGEIEAANVTGIAVTGKGIEELVQDFAILDKVSFNVNDEEKGQGNAVGINGGTITVTGNVYGMAGSIGGDATGIQGNGMISAANGSVIGMAETVNGDATGIAGSGIASVNVIGQAGSVNGTATAINSAGEIKADTVTGIAGSVNGVATGITGTGITAVNVIGQAGSVDGAANGISSTGTIAATENVISMAGSVNNAATAISGGTVTAKGEIIGMASSYTGSATGIVGGTIAAGKNVTGIVGSYSGDATGIISNGSITAGGTVTGIAVTGKETEELAKEFAALNINDIEDQFAEPLQGDATGIISAGSIIADQGPVIGMAVSVDGNAIGIKGDGDVISNHGSVIAGADSINGNAVAITGHGEEIKTKGEVIAQAGSENGDAVGIYGDRVINAGNNNIVTAVSINGDAVGIYGGNSLTAEQGNNIIVATSANGEAYGIYADGKNNSLTAAEGHNIVLGDTAGIKAINDSTVTFSGKTNQVIGGQYGIAANNSDVTFTATNGDNYFVSANSRDDSALTTTDGEFSNAVNVSSDAQFTAEGQNNILMAGEITNGYGSETAVSAVGGNATFTAAENNELYGAVYANNGTVNITAESGDNVVLSATHGRTAGGDESGIHLVSALYAAEGSEISLSATNGVNRIYSNFDFVAGHDQDREITVWAEDGGEVSLDGAVEIVASNYGNYTVDENGNPVKGNALGIAVSAGSRNADVANTDASTVTIDYTSAEHDSLILGDVVAGKNGVVTISGISNSVDGVVDSGFTRGGKLQLVGNLLSANGGKLDVNFTKGSYWEGRADDYGDADIAGHEGFFNPAFSNAITSGGTTNVTMDEGYWMVTAQSWLTNFTADDTIIDMVSYEGEGADAMSIKNMEGSGSTFIMDLNKNNKGTSDMLYIKGGNADIDIIVNGTIEGLSSVNEADTLRFATIGEGIRLMNSDERGTYITGEDGGVFGTKLYVKKYEYDAADPDNNEYNGGSDVSADKPGSGSVEDFFNPNADANKKSAADIALLDEPAGNITPDNWEIVGFEADGYTAAGAAVLSLGKVNYSNAIYMDRFNKRMGEARFIDGDEGVWVRLRHDRIGKENAFRSQNTMYEIGYDVKQVKDNGEHRIGFAFDYMDGESSFTGVNGRGEVSRAGLWAYDSWMGEKGHYRDIVAKWGHLSNDFDFTTSWANDMHADFSNNVYSISAEYGKKNAIGSDWYFEPQVQLQYAYVTDAYYGTSINDTAQTQLHNDAFDSLIARAGFRLGRDISDHSTVYFKGDVLHEFMGDQDIYAKDETTGGIVKNIGYENDGTWYDLGFGFATKVNKASYAYLDFEKSFGNDNDETYQINAGMQWSF